MTLDATAIGKRILKARSDKGISQKELADQVLALGLDAVRITSPYISRIERGERLPSTRVLAGIATVLGSTVDYLETGVLWWTVTGVQGGDSGFVSSIKAPDPRKAEEKALAKRPDLVLSATFAGRLDTV